MKKRLISLFLAMSFLLSLLPKIVLPVSAETIASGTSEEGFHWELDNEGTLTISGEGAMDDHSPAGAGYGSWVNANVGFHDVKIQKVVISEGITKIGDSAFASCSYLKSVEIPDTVTEIGGWAFLVCEKLEAIHIPTSVRFIGDMAFQACEKLEQIVLPEGIPSIGDQTFAYCTSLQSIVIPSSVTSIGTSAFANCDQLRQIYFTGNAPLFGDGTYDYVFDSVIATAYYPANNSTWTADIMQDHGGFITWEPIDSLGNTNPTEERPSQFIPVVESRIVECKFDSLSAEKQQECRGILCDLDSDGNDELILRYVDRWSDLVCEVWDIQGGIPYCVNTVDMDNGGLETNGSISLATYEGQQYLVYQWKNSGMDYVNDLSEVFCLMDGKFESVRSVSISNLGKLTPIMRSNYWLDEDEEPEGIIFSELADYLENTVNVVPNDELVDDQENKNGLVIYSDYTNLSIRKGSTITLSVGILADGELTGDVSGITFQIEDTSILGVSTTDIKDNCRYVKLKGLSEGTTAVAFNDSATGYVSEVLVTVYYDNYLSYTLNSVPTQNIEKYPTNVYNVNGIYIDSYKYTVNDDQSATVSFDVYNTNYTYGVVEVFDENGNMKDAVLIEKMTSSNTSIKTAVWDNIGYLVRDIIDGDLLSYRQESGYTKKTSVSVKIPQNGYIKICTDPENSLIVGLINSVDGLMSMASLAGDIKDFDVNSQEFSKKLTMKLLTDQVYVELIKDGSDAPKDLWKNVGKETFITSESMGSFTDTITKNIDELKLGSVIADTAMDFGWDVGENVFTYFAGPAGTALNVMFTIGKVENLIIQQNDLIQSAGVGSIYIQNQGGGLRACQQIKVDSEEGFADDTALNVFSVTLESDVLDIIEKYNPDIYEQIVDGVTYTFNISLMKNGSETQPNGEVTVYIPIPDELKALAYAGDLVDGIPVKVKIYRIEEDGALTEMDIRIEDGCFVFITDHFSLYTIVGCDSGDDTTPNQDENGLPTIMIIGIVTIVTVGVGAAVIIKRKKK